MVKIWTVEILELTSPVVHQVVKIKVPQEASVEPVEEMVIPLLCLLVTSVSKQQSKDLNHFSLNAVPLKMLELLKMKKVDLKDLPILNSKMLLMLKRHLNSTDKT